MASLSSDWEPYLFTSNSIFRTKRDARSSAKAGKDFLRLWGHVQPTPSWLTPPPLPPLSEAVVTKLTQLFELANSVVVVRSPLSKKEVP